MDRSHEKHTGSGYLTQASVGWEPRFRFNPLKSPPNFSILSIFQSFLRGIDKLPTSDFKFVPPTINHQPFIFCTIDIDCLGPLDIGCLLRSFVLLWKM